MTIEAWTETYDGGVTAVDSGYHRARMAACYLVEADDAVAIVETGTKDSVPRLLAALEARGRSPEDVRFVIVTHVHLDHAGGAGRLMQACPNATFLVHPRGARHMIDPSKLEASVRQVYGDAVFERDYGTLVPIPEDRTRIVEDGDTVELGDRPLLFMDTPGHARHHFCIWDEATAGWFTGDMFGVSYDAFRFAAGDFILPTTTPSQFEPGDYLDSMALLGSYAPAVMYLTHFGALQYSAATSERLAQQVAGYRDLALACDDAGLEDAVQECSLALLRPLAPGLAEPELRALLSLDMPLNLMGLRDWRDRQAA